MEIRQLVLLWIIKHKIIIDECYGCGGKFLDYQELDEIRNEYATEEERAKDVVEYLRANMGEEFDEMHAHKRKASMDKEGNPIKYIIKKFF